MAEKKWFMVRYVMETSWPVEAESEEEAMEKGWDSLSEDTWDTVKSGEVTVRKATAKDVKSYPIEGAQKGKDPETGKTWWFGGEW